MRNRSHRLPMTEPRHDDWVDGSWTVDCVCGVTFDDGEEMVNCDECGVWVHTRCSRYVKSEKSFACDKCKNKSKSSFGGGGSSRFRNESEETEVAEFLVELPNKALGTDNPNSATVASRKPFRLWTEIPMEEKVHVQGMPGGEPSLFSGIGMSSIFGPQLWKASGYVPKKFNLRYTEFPFLGKGKAEVKEGEEAEMDKANGEKNSARADNGARVLVSLNRNDSSAPTPVVDSAIVKGFVEGRAFRKIVAPGQKLDGEKLDPVPEDGITKKRNSVTVVLNSGKRKKEEHRASKDQNVKKKVRVIEKEGDVRKRAAHGPKPAASTFSSDTKHLESSQDRSCKVVNNDLQCDKNQGHQPLDRLGECATNLATNEHGLEATPKNEVSSSETLRADNKGAQVPVESENLSNTSNGVESLTDVNCLHSLPVNEEVTGDTLQRCLAGTGSVGIDSCEKEPVIVDVRISAGDAKESEHGQDSVNDEADLRPSKKLRTELDADDHGDHLVESVHLNDIKLDGPEASTQYPILSVNVNGEGNLAGTSNTRAEESEAKVLDAKRSLVVDHPRADKTDESTANAHHSKREHSGPEGSTGARKRSSGLKPSSEVTGELLKSNGTARSHSTASYHRKAGVSILRSTSTSGIMSKSSENCMAATVQNSSVHIRQELSDSSQGTTKDNASTDKVERVEKSGRPKKLLKESSRSGAVVKVSETNKLSNTSDPKRPSSDLKDPRENSSKVPLGSNVSSSNVTAEAASMPPTEGASNMQNKAAVSATSGKGEKPYQSGCNPSSRGHVASMTSPASSNVPTTLSDEELALLLHQELNSSPRVPRVPRMRHAGSLPQLSGPGATSTLMKQSSNGGGKDHGMVSRRRTKDFSGVGLQAYPEIDNEAKKVERKPNSPDRRRQGSSYSIDQQSRKEADGGLVKSVQSKKTNMNSPLSSSTDANGHHKSSSRLSSRSLSDDDPRMAGRQMNRTLPGLIAEIMSEGKRMTYEELCNAVLPHWPHLRKHNGERYAYSSHSQAVLDCLRNRSEWARLVDRGPKTSASRKRRKFDSDSVSIESEDNENHIVKSSKDAGSKSFDSHQEDFPKGKRKTRNRRQLALQGRGIVRRRRRADVVSDDESESFSYSSEDSMSSEEEVQGGGTSEVGDVSASSDEAE